MRQDSKYSTELQCLVSVFRSLDLIILIDMSILEALLFILYDTVSLNYFRTCILVKHVYLNYQTRGIKGYDTYLFHDNNLVGMEMLSRIKIASWLYTVLSRVSAEM